MNMSDDWRARSPFLNESHEAVAQSVRRFVEREAAPYIDAWEADRGVPRECFNKAGDAGILGLGFPEEFGGTSEGMDIFHTLVQIDELSRLGSGGFLACMTTHAIAIPTILEVASDEIKHRVVPGILSGRKTLCIAITEPSGGSDVANLRTRAVRQGDQYLVSGSKIFASGGICADFYLVAVRTGGEGKEGLSLLLMEKGMAGLSHTKLEKMGYHCQDTAALYFDDVAVPVKNLIGLENKGFAAMTRTFNGERLRIAQHCCSFARVCLEEAVAWAQQRETFGKRLGQHQVIRVKLANMVRQIQATQAWVEICAKQYCEGKERPADFALLKVQATQTFESVARDASQVLGSASLLVGSKTERLFREARINAIGGGSEEILLDLAGRQLKFG